MSEDQAFYQTCDAVSADAGNQCSCGQALCPDEVTYLRYEALRRLNPRQFEALWNRNMAGENFDAMVDEMVRKNATESEVRVSTEFLPERKMRSPEEVRDRIAQEQKQQPYYFVHGAKWWQRLGRIEALKWVLNEQPTEGEKT